MANAAPSMEEFFTHHVVIILKIKNAGYEYDTIALLAKKLLFSAIYSLIKNKGINAMKIK